MSRTKILLCKKDPPAELNPLKNLESAKLLDATLPLKSVRLMPPSRFSTPFH